MVAFSIILLILCLFEVTWDKYLDYDGTIYITLHILAGLLIPIFVIYLSGKMQFTEPNVIIKNFDKYTYSLYVVHQVFILGPLSVLHFTENSGGNIAIALLACIISSLLLQNISEHLSRFLSKI